MNVITVLYSEAYSFIPLALLLTSRYKFVDLKIGLRAGRRISLACSMNSVVLDGYSCIARPLFFFNGSPNV